MRNWSILKSILRCLEDPIILRDVTKNIVNWSQKLLKITYTFDEIPNTTKLYINILPFIPSLATNNR